MAFLPLLSFAVVLVGHVLACVGQDADECSTWPFVFVSGERFLNPRIQDNNRNRSYAKAIPPGLVLQEESNLTTVKVTTTIAEIDTLDDYTKTLSLTAALTWWWQDQRLRLPEECYNVTMSHMQYHVEDINDLVWIPELRVSKLWRVGERKLFQDDHGIIFRPYESAFVTYGMFTLDIKCDLNYERYPFDTQNCVLAQTSANVGERLICVTWDSPISFSSVTGIIRRNWERGPDSDSSGNWQQKIFMVIPRNTSKKACHDRVEILFEFTRYRTSYLIQTFLPSFLLVLGSLVSLWVPSGHVPARMTLAVTTTLTLMSMINSVFTYAPRTSYLKLMDVWLMTCFFFTFLCLLEYCLVLYLIKSSDWYETWHRRTSVKKTRHVAMTREYGRSSASSASRWKMGTAFVLEKWAGVLVPLMFFTFSIWFCVIVLFSTELSLDEVHFIRKAIKAH